MIESKSYGLQSETRQYLRRLYAYGRELAPTDVADIDNFIKGLKQLNLWQNIVCWPMRSIHNIGSASRVLSIGGLGNFDATLLNSATWSNEGVNRVTSSGDFFSTTVNRIDVAPCAHGAVVKNATDLGNNIGYWFTAGVNVSGRQFNIANSGGLQTQILNTYVNIWPPGAAGPSNGNLFASSFTRTSRHYFSLRLTTGLTGRFTLNAVQVNQASSANNWNSSSPQFVRFGAYNVALNLTASFTYLSNSVVTDAQDSALYDLLKTTICKGLGLP